MWRRLRALTTSNGRSNANGYPHSILPCDPSNLPHHRRRRRNHRGCVVILRIELDRSTLKWLVVEDGWRVVGRFDNPQEANAFRRQLLRRRKEECRICKS